MEAEPAVSRPPGWDRNVKPTPRSELSPDQQELTRTLRKLRHSPSMLGIWALGKDGVMRSLSSTREVVDAVPLPPRLIKAHCDRRPWDQKTEDRFRGVDGMAVSEERWWNPDMSDIPAPLSEEARERALEIIEGQGGLEAMRKKQEEGRQESAKCGVCIFADHNLEAKVDADEKTEANTEGAISEK